MRFMKYFSLSILAGMVILLGYAYLIQNNNNVPQDLSSLNLTSESSSSSPFAPTSIPSRTVEKIGYGVATWIIFFLALLAPLLITILPQPAEAIAIFLGGVFCAFFFTKYQWIATEEIVLICTYFFCCFISSLVAKDGGSKWKMYFMFLSLAIFAWLIMLLLT